MGCCISNKPNHKNVEIYCPLCKKLGNNIHYLAVEIIVKEDVLSEVTKEAYFVCTNKSCDVVFYNENKDRIFLSQDINMGADFDEITKTNNSGCNSACGNCNRSCGSSSS